MTISNFFAFIKNYAPICISLIAVYIAWKSYQRSQLPLDSYCPPDSTPLKVLLLDDDEGKSLRIPRLQSVNLTVINPSDVDLDFFSLKLMDDTNNKELTIISNDVIQMQTGYSSHSAIDGYGNHIVTNLFDDCRLTGTFKAHSITSFTIPFQIADNTKRCLLVYKVARHKKLRDCHSKSVGYTGSKYETHEHVFTINDAHLSEIEPESEQESK